MRFVQMSEKRFSVFDDDEVEDIWNELKGTIYCYDEEEAQRCENWLNNLHNQNQKLKEENEQLQKQIQNYEQLISNSYVGIEETLDGFVGKYVIWEDELQKYRKKNKKR